ncbi:peptidoglycan-binding domain-containing protein [Amycolatopsis nigrescens]|uniref:peptidoglycan-binding domain-containing protein n=1 Tax=Amycolatopsis nigrescens TaxID=381445 RepID=UPI00036D2502|nr:peptidoglycan-binding domain-containing protein [Amycolatopsis nigrescens]
MTTDSESRGDTGVAAEPRRSRRTRWFVGTAVALVVAGTVSVVVLTRVAGSSAGQAPAAPPPVQTTPVVKTDLSDQESADGTLGYGAERALAGRKPGTVTALPTVGAVIERGKSVYGVDARPVPLFYGSLPLYRDLVEGMEDGPDVKVVEENLRALGFGGFGKADEKFTSATASALKKWQKSLELPETGTLTPGDVVVEPGAIRVASVSAALGGQSGGDLMKVTGTDRAVTVELELAKQKLAKPGEKVKLTVSGGKPSTGTITSSEVEEDSGGGGEQPPGGSGEDPKVKVTIALDDQAAAGDLGAAPVEVLFTTGTRTGVLTVPVGALLALAEGGYAVEVAGGVDGGRRLLPVELGLFADGKVEVSGDGLREGIQVVTTS